MHLKIPLPPSNIQSQLIKLLDQEMNIIEGNKLLVKGFTKKPKIKLTKYGRHKNRI